MFPIIRIGFGTRVYQNWTERDFPTCSRLWTRTVPTRTDLTTISSCKKEQATGTHCFGILKELNYFFPFRINSDGLNHAKELYRLDSVTKHHAFTSIQIKTDVKQIHKIGMKYIEKLESFMKAMEGEGNQL